MEKNLTLVPSSMLSTVSALGAQNMGAGKYDRADQILRCAMGIAVRFGVCVAVLIQFIAEPVVGLFTTDTMVAILCVRIPGGISYFEVFPGYAVSYGTGNSDGIFAFRDHLRDFLRMAEETGTKQKENDFCLTTLYISAIMYKNKETGACVTG